MPGWGIFGATLVLHRGTRDREQHGGITGAVELRRRDGQHLGLSGNELAQEGHSARRIAVTRVQLGGQPTARERRDEHRDARRDCDPVEDGRRIANRPSSEITTISPATSTERPAVA
ncbi:MAG TPA: hypothetical protein VNA28_12565, partial [Solirubrobacteraceae bacterium]|nr:hypothetical protein [Solirubrobacteraceae bacterium]